MRLFFFQICCLQRFERKDGQILDSIRQSFRRSLGLKACGVASAISKTKKTKREIAEKTLARDAETLAARHQSNKIFIFAERFPRRQRKKLRKERKKSAKLAGHRALDPISGRTFFLFPFQFLSPSLRRRCGERKTKDQQPPAFTNSLAAVAGSKNSNGGWVFVFSC